MNDEDFEELEDIQEEQKSFELILRKNNPRISKTQILEKNPRYKSLETRRRKILNQLHAECEVQYAPKYVAPKRYVPPSNPRPWDFSYWTI